MDNSNNDVLSNSKDFSSVTQLRILFNDEHEKMISMCSITGTGRAANSALALQILGTKTEDGDVMIRGNENLKIDNEFLPVLDLLLQWLQVGDTCLQSSLNDDNASLLYGLAEYFSIFNLIDAIELEKKRRDGREEFRLKFTKLTSDMRDIIQKIANGGVRCVRCTRYTTVPSSYKGKTPKCVRCRVRVDYESDSADYYYDDLDEFGFDFDFGEDYYWDHRIERYDDDFEYDDGYSFGS